MEQRIMLSINELCDVIRETGYAIHLYHGHGHLEKVYENALVHRLRKAGHDVQQQRALAVHDEDGTIVGEYFADLFIDGRLIVEVKAIKAVGDDQVAQILGYLKSSRIEHGLLINFGSPRFWIKKYILSQRTSINCHEKTQRAQKERPAESDQQQVLHVSLVFLLRTLRPFVALHCDSDLS